MYEEIVKNLKNNNYGYSCYCNKSIFVKMLFRVSFGFVLFYKECFEIEIFLYFIFVLM